MDCPMIGFAGPAAPWKNPLGLSICESKYSCQGVRRHGRNRCAKRRRTVIRSVADPLEDLAGPAKGLTYDQIRSDEEYVVLDAKEVARIVEEMQRSGRDPFGTSDTEPDGTVSEDFMTFAERRIDEWNEQLIQEYENREENLDDSHIKEESRKNRQSVGMKYFCDDHVKYMPKWAAEAFETGEHVELFNDASRTWPLSSGQRLHDIIARKKVTIVDGKATERAGMDGIIDCTVADVGEDYSVPVEFVVDAMLHFGVPTPIVPEQSIRGSMTTEEIEKLLGLITSFDAQDLTDRYSDCSIEELADNYNLSVDDIIQVCEKERLYVCQGKHTRLSTVREDRVLEIILNGAEMGQPYPSLLEGLV